MPESLAVDLGELESVVRNEVGKVEAVRFSEFLILRGDVPVAGKLLGTVADSEDDQEAGVHHRVVACPGIGQHAVTNPVEGKKRHRHEAACGVSVGHS